jgi:hypothetical protein
VRYEKIGKRALQDHDTDALVGLQFLAEPVEFRRKNFIKKIDRRVIDADERHSGIKSELETLVVRISHSSGSISVIVR